MIPDLILTLNSFMWFCCQLCYCYVFYSVSVTDVVTTTTTGALVKLNGFRQVCCCYNWNSCHCRYCPCSSSHLRMQELIGVKEGLRCKNFVAGREAGGIKGRGWSAGYKGFLWAGRLFSRCRIVAGHKTLEPLKSVSHSASTGAECVTYSL